ncbi:MAG TPA: PP2C family protein-serine/threonine phosphatase [Candidatus Limnocylindrales bacterium]|nr:PP2C family protein-serine/threonine phosphatase [Candidatus Limnocylindrales bacterium]
MSERQPPGGPGLEAILAPFLGLGPSFSVVIEGADGQRVAGTTEGDVPPESIRRDIVAGPLAGGHVVAWGSSIDTPVAVASVASMAVALGIAHTVRSAGIADLAAARRIEQELALGRQLQRSFVGLVGPEIPGYDLACHYEQAYEVGGDFFDVFRRLGRGRPLSVVVADVTGKGIGAAMLMAFARPVIHAAIDNSNGPAEALERTNRVLRERGASLFITAICASLTVSTGRLRVANAGHEPPLLVRRDGSPIVPLEGWGPLLGAFPSLDLVESVASLGPGDAVVLYTDGVTDARSASGERFEDARLLAAIEDARGGSAADIVGSITGSVDRFQAGTPPADDVTLVVIGRRTRDSRRRVVDYATG